MVALVYNLREERKNSEFTNQENNDEVKKKIEIHLTKEKCLLELFLLGVFCPRNILLDFIWFENDFDSTFSTLNPQWPLEQCNKNLDRLQSIVDALSLSLFVLCMFFSWNSNAKQMGNQMCSY